VYSIHDIFFALSVLLALVGSAGVAFWIYADLVRTHPLAAYVFIGYLVVAGLASIFAPIILRYARRTRQLALDEYLKQEFARQ
jgi:hypothetical protein